MEITPGVTGDRPLLDAKITSGYEYQTPLYCVNFRGIDYIILEQNIFQYT